jgi:hypothetical protein
VHIQKGRKGHWLRTEILQEVQIILITETEAAIVRNGKPTSTGNRIGEVPLELYPWRGLSDVEQTIDIDVIRREVPDIEEKLHGQSGVVRLLVNTTRRQRGLKGCSR